MTPHLDFVGFWEIIDCTPRSSLEGGKGIEGAIFELTKNGDIRWKVSENTSDIPLLKCDTYKIVYRGHSPIVALLRLGTYRGHILEFQIDTFRGAPALLMMSKGWCLMQCRRVGPPPVGPAPPPYSLLPALEDGYFSDLEIVAENKKVFKVHLCVLQMSSPELEWTSDPPPLSGLPEDVLGTALHYLYAQCLPSTLVPSTAENVLTLFAEVPALHGLRKLCTTYLSHLAFKNQIAELLEDIHACAERMTERFSRQDFCYDPEKLCESLKEAAREAAVAVAKLILLCDIYSRIKGELSDEAGNALIRFIHSRGPTVWGRFKKFLFGLSSALTGLQSPQRQDLAIYLVPELENMLDTFSTLLSKTGAVVDNLLKQDLKDELEESILNTSGLECNLNSVLYRKEIMQLRSLLTKITAFRRLLDQRRECFKTLSNSDKVRSLNRSLEQLIEELPVLWIHLEDISGGLNQKFQWNDSQFCFKVGTAKVCETLQKLVRDQSIARDLIIQLCHLVAEESFYDIMLTLGLLSPRDVSYGERAIYNVKTEEEATPKESSCKLNLIDTLSKPPCAEENALSEAAAELLKSRDKPDMEFEVVEEGMQEDIQRRIEIHGTNPQIFTNFLEYLYTGKLNASASAGDQLAELLLLSDRYEYDDLKTACEEGLKTYLNEDTIFEILSLADQLNALTLKQSCADLIREEPSLVRRDVCRELPKDLRKEVNEWKRMSTRPRPFRRDPEVPSLLSLSGVTPDSSNSRPEKLSEVVTRLRSIVGNDTSSVFLENIVSAADNDLNRALELFFYATS